MITGRKIMIEKRFFTVHNNHSPPSPVRPGRCGRTHGAPHIPAAEATRGALRGQAAYSRKTFTEALKRTALMAIENAMSSRKPTFYRPSRIHNPVVPVHERGRVRGRCLLKIFLVQWVISRRPLLSSFFPDRRCPATALRICWLRQRRAAIFHRSSCLRIRARPTKPED